MIGLILSDTHVLYGEWLSAKEKYTLEELKYVPLKKPLKELIKTQKELNTVLGTALKDFNLIGKEVVIAIDDDLLFHDKFATDESISNKEIWDYIQWETKQKWGELGDYYTTFAEKDSPTTSVLHCVTCPSLLISEIKAIISSQKGNPLWLGPVSAIYLENNEITNAVYMLDDDSFIRFYFRGRDGYSEGKLRFVGGQPNISVVVGDKEEQSKLFNTKNDVFKFVTIDLISENKNSNLRQYRPQRMIPFEEVDVKVEDIPEDVSFKLLNVLSILVKDFSYKYLINFFNPTQIQEKSYEGLGELNFDIDGERIDKVEKPKNRFTKSDSAEIKKIKKPEKKPKLKVEKKPTADDKSKSDSIKKPEPQDKKRSSLLPYLLIVLVGAVCFYLFFTDSGKNIVSNFKEIIGIKSTKENSEALKIFDTYLNQSTAMLDVYNNLTEIISPDSIISLTLIGNSGNIEFVGTDSLNISNLIPSNYLVEPIECCGGIKQYVEFNIGYVEGIKYNIWVNFEDVINQLNNTFQISKIRILEDVIENEIAYKPVIFAVNSADLLEKMVKYLELIGDNVIVRKISFTNTPPETDLSVTFYISIFEAL